MNLAQLLLITALAFTSFAAIAEPIDTDPETRIAKMAVELRQPIPTLREIDRTTLASR